MSNPLKKITLSFVFLIFAIVSSHAQMCDPCPPGWTCVGMTCMPPISSAEVPIDGGVLGLLVVGAVYGAKKIYDQRKSQ